MEKENEDAKMSTTINKKMDRRKNKSIRKNLQSFVNLFMERGY